MITECPPTSNFTALPDVLGKMQAIADKANEEYRERQKAKHLLSLEALRHVRRSGGKIYGLRIRKERRYVRNYYHRRLQRFS